MQIRNYLEHKIAILIDIPDVIMQGINELYVKILDKKKLIKSV